MIVSQRRIADVLVPMLDGQLTGDQGGFESVSPFDHFHQVVALGSSDPGPVPTKV